MTTFSSKSLLDIKEIANRLRHFNFVEETLLFPANRNPNPLYHALYPPPSEMNVLDDCPGMILLFSELDRLFPDESWDAASYTYVLKIKEDIEKNGIPSLALFGGLAGLCFSIHSASRGGELYQKMVKTLTNHLTEEIERSYFIPLKKHFERGEASEMLLYDLIQGIVGIGVYCLSNLFSLSHLVKQIIEHLLMLIKPITVMGKSAPGWYVSPKDPYLQRKEDLYPNGNFNLGLAHGIPGVLAFLSIALLHGVDIKGQKEAIHQIAEWLQSHRKGDKGEFFWEADVFFDLDQSKEGSGSTSSRDAWCYGTPGVARSLFLAGKALNSENLKAIALESFRSIFTRSREQWNLPGPTICHGISGLLLITHFMYQDTQDEGLLKHREELKQMVLDDYHPHHPFGFKDFDSCQGGGYFEIDKISLLEGASGVLLTLLSLENPTSFWHAPLLISENYG